MPDALAKSSSSTTASTSKVRARDAAAGPCRIDWSPAENGFLCVGSLSERKNVLRLARAFDLRREGGLAFVGDGTLHVRSRAGRRSISREGRSRSGSAWMAAAVSLPAHLAEPFGLATLEGLVVGAISRRNEHRRAARVRAGGRGVLVDPTDDDSVARGLDCGGAAPGPNLAARSAAEAHDVRRRAERVEELLARLQLREVLEPGLDERAGAVFRARRPGASSAAS